MATQNIKRKKIATHLTDREKTRSLKNSAISISKPFPSRQTEEALRQSEERYRTILEEMEEGYFETDLVGNLTFINDAGCRNLGYSREELIGKNNRVYADEENAKKVFQAFNKLYRTGEPRRVFDYETIQKDGTKTINELWVSLIRDSEGKRIGFRGISRHVTERKKAEEALRQSEEKYRTILENMQEAYYELDLAGHFTFVNDALCKHLRYTKEELIGTRSRQYQDETTTKEMHQIFTEVYRTGEPVKALESKYVRKDGTKGDYEVSVSLIRDSEGKPIGFRGVSRNITERKRAEEALRESEETAKRLARENAIMAEIGRIVSSTLKIEEVYERFAEEVRKFIQFERITINNINPKENTFVVLYNAGPHVADREVGKPVPLPGTATEWVMQNRSSLLILEANREEMLGRIPGLLPIFKAGFRSMMLIPLISKDQVIGTLALQTARQNAYAEVDLKLAYRVSAQVAGAIANAQLFNERLRAEEALRQSEERYRNILESIQEGYFETDLDGNYAFVNDANSKFLGYSKEELAGMNYRQHSNEKTVEELRTHYTRLYRTGKPIEGLEVESIRKDGSKAIYETSVSLMRDSEGEPIGFRGVSRDITDRKRAEEALRRSEERYRTILENIEEAYFEDDLAGNFTFVNDVLCKLLGYTRQELIGMNNRQYTDEENAAKLRELYAGLYKTGKPIKAFDLEAIKKDGTKAIYETSVSLMRDSEGKPIGFRGVSREVTERNKMEAALREREDQYRTLLETMEEGYYQVDLTGDLTFFNDSFCKMHGSSIEKMLGMNNREYMPEETARRVYKIFNEVYKTGQPVRLVEWEIIRGDGGKAVMEASVYLIKNAQGERIGFRGIERDITERKRTEELLSQSEEKYRTILESIEDGYYEEDLAGNFVFFNEALCRIYGYPKEELLGLNYKKYTNEETAKRLFQIFNEMYRTGNPCNEYSYELTRKDGAKRYIEASASLKRDSSGKPTGFRGVVRDITERKQAEEALRHSEERYRTILETMQEAYYELDLAGHFTFANDALSKHLGHTKEELIGTKSNQYQDEAEAKKTYQAFNEIYRTGEPIKALWSEYIRKDGTKGTYELSASLMRDAQGKPIGFRGVTRDITERKQAEEALRHSEERYRTIIENIQDGYFEGDLAGNFTFANDVICRHLGYTREETIGMNYRQYTDEEHAKELYQHYSELYKTGQPIKPFEAGYVRKDGGKLIAEISVSLIRDPKGKPIGFRGISRDITERKREEEEKLSLQEQLRQSQKMEAIGQLAGGVAHDFNNLLTVIKGYSQISLLDLKENDPLRGNIQEIEKATQRATDLTRQLLAFSRRQILDSKVVDLNALLKDLEKMLRRIIGEDIELVALLSEDLGRVKIDPSQIEQVIFNLAVNARDAMPSGGKLTIETANVELDEVYAHAHVGVIPGRYVSLSVSDTGVGMSQEVKEKVFEPFFTTKGKGKGTGLGLSMVYGIVKQSNGNIWVYSEPGRGTTFKINLPRIEEALDALRQRDEADSFPGGNETVLLVEDDELVRDLAHRLLKQQGYTVWVAVNGEDALRVAREHDGEKIHLLLSDIVMPQMGGKELADKLKILRPDIKVLYTSGYADDAIVHHGVLDPGTHFLQKPFSLKTLSHKVREVLDG
jgi:PAS domain S-box-containing protein